MWIVLAGLLGRRARVVVQVFLAVGFAELVVLVAHAEIHRHRPFEHQLGRHEHSHSFPSGHALTAFAGATMLAVQVPRYRVALYTLAALIALSRLYNGVHYPSDVLAGAAAGVAIALLLRAAGRRRSRPGSPAG